MQGPANCIAPADLGLLRDFWIKPMSLSPGHGVTELDDLMTACMIVAWIIVGGADAVRWVLGKKHSLALVAPTPASLRAHMCSFVVVRSVSFCLQRQRKKVHQA